VRRSSSERRRVCEARTAVDDHLKTAKALGVTVPLRVSGCADEVIKFSAESAFEKRRGQESPGSVCGR